jgi:hypothetical protein
VSQQNRRHATETRKRKPKMLPTMIAMFLFLVESALASNGGGVEEGEEDGWTVEGVFSDAEGMLFELSEGIAEEADVGIAENDVSVAGKLPDMEGTGGLIVIAEDDGGVSPPYVQSELSGILGP